MTSCRITLGSICRPFLLRPTRSRFAGDGDNHLTYLTTGYGHIGSKGVEKPHPARPQLYADEGRIGAERLEEANFTLPHTPVTDISALKNLKRLTWFDLSYTPVKDISALKDLKSLSIVNLIGTQVTDVSALKGVKSLQISR